MSARVLGSAEESFKYLSSSNPERLFASTWSVDDHSIRLIRRIDLGRPFGFAWGDMNRSIRLIRGIDMDRSRAQEWS